MLAQIRLSTAFAVMAAIIGLNALLFTFTPAGAAIITFASEQKAKIVRPKALFVGDSLTVNGSPWGHRISGDPLCAVTAARAGFLAWQMAPLTEMREWHLKPEFVSYMAGTNDAGTGRISDAASLADQMANIDRLLKSGSRLIVTLAPPAADRVRSERVARMNVALLEHLHGRPILVIDLWPKLANQGVIRREFTTDGTHFTPAAYDVWSGALREAMKR